MKFRPTITWLQYAFANAVIVVLLPLLMLQGMPPIDWAWSWMRPTKEENARSDEEELEPEPEPDATPVADWLLTTVSPIADATGASTAPWKMFAPEPDATNHRLRAKIEYQDGVVVEWRSPEWPQLSCWQRFWTSRELEYIDKIAYASPPDRWFAYADFLAAQNRENSRPEGSPKRVTFVFEEGVIANPNENGWLPMSQPIPRRREVISPKRVYPVPPELLQKRTATSAGQNSP